MEYTPLLPGLAVCRVLCRRSSGFRRTPPCFVPWGQPWRALWWWGHGSSYSCWHGVSGWKVKRCWDVSYFNLKTLAPSNKDEVGYVDRTQASAWCTRGSCSSLLFHGIFGIICDASQLNVSIGRFIEAISEEWKLAGLQVPWLHQHVWSRIKVIGECLSGGTSPSPWRSILLCWILAALGHVFLLEQPCGSHFRSFPHWRYFCKYICRVPRLIQQSHVVKEGVHEGFNKSYFFLCSTPYRFLVPLQTCHCRTSYCIC